MKISDVKVKNLRIPYPSPMPGLTWPPRPIAASMSIWVVEVSTDEEIKGIGIARRGFNEGLVKSKLVGMDPYNIEAVIQALSALRVEEPAIIEMALWDVIGKAAHQPVYKLIGGWSRDKIKVYMSTDTLKSPQDMADYALQSLEEGFKAIKVKVHRRKGEKLNIETVKAVRDAVGDEMEIMTDASRSWSRRTSFKLARAFERYDVAWLEEPLPRDDVSGYAELAKAVDIPIAGGEHETEWTRFKLLIESGGWDIIQPDEIRVGGITNLKKIASLAEAHYVPCNPHAVRWAGLHVIATSENCQYAEYLHDPPFLWIDIRYQMMLKDPIVVKDGYIELPKKPGLGVELNEEFIAKHELAQVP